MSEWNRGGREEEQRRSGFDERRHEREESRWSDNPRGGEQRNFDDRNRGGQEWRTSQGDRGQGSYGEDYRGGSQGYGGGQNERQDYGRQGYGGQSFGGQDYGGQGYGGQSYANRDYQSGQHAGQTGLGAQDERLQRVSDGDFDRGQGAFGFDRNRQGEHRGRGPKNYTRSDERIREDINDRLSDDSWLDATEIEVQVSQCEVTLTGTVNGREDKRRAEDIAEQVSGVKHVQNNLRVQQQAGAQQMGGQQTGGSQGAAQASGGQATGQSSASQSRRT